MSTRPAPALHGRGLVVLLAAVACVVAAIATQPQRGDLSVSYRFATLGMVTAMAAVLAAIQPNGIWQAAPCYVAIIAAIRLERRTGVIVLLTSLVVLVAVSAIGGHLGSALSATLGAVPWFLVIRIELVASASNGEEALALTAEHHPEVVLMDLRMPRLDGIEATRRLRESHPEVRVIALTTFADDESVLGALRAGARGYLTKDASSSDIQAAILTVAAGDAALDPAVQHHVVAALAQPIQSAPQVGSRSGSRSAPGAAELPDDLTQREAEVLALIAEG